MQNLLLALAALLFVHSSSPALAAPQTAESAPPTAALSGDAVSGNADDEFVEEESPVREWTGRLGDYVHKYSYDTANQLSNIIWDSINEFTITSFNSGRFSAKIRARRAVFDNHDINNTYTVADRLHFNTSLSLWSKTLASGEIANDILANFGVSLGTSQGIEFLNIRQVRTNGYSLLPSIGDISRRVFGAVEDPNAPKAEIPGADLPLFDETKPEDAKAADSLSILDPLRRARYGHFTNLVTFPIALPIKAEWLSKLEDSEIMSYNLYGSVQVGASVGWSADMTGIFKSMTGSLSYSAYLRGDYRVTILKEDSRYARVKLTRTYTNGRSGGMNASTDDYQWFDGFLVFGHRVAEKSFHIVPFRIQVDRSNAEAFDVGYRYDLTKPEARKAYELAAIGRFAFSEELAGGLKGSPEARPDTGVEKIFTRDQKISTRYFSTGVNIASFYRHGNSANFTNWDAIVTLPDGTRRIVTTDAVNAKEWKTLWGTYERSNTSFRVNLDVDRYAQGLKDALYLTVESMIEDSTTDGEELRKYTVQVENAVGEENIFPRFPLQRPETPQETEQRLRNRADTYPASSDGADAPQLVDARYGTSSFYYRLMFSQRQVEKFIDFPEERMWEALEKAFEIEAGEWNTALARMWYYLKNSPGMVANIPLYVFNVQFYNSPKLYHAKLIYDLWAELKNTPDANQRVQTLGRLFNDHIYGHELVMLLRYVLQGEEIAYLATATAPPFGRIWKQGKAVIDFYPLPDRISQEIDFDREASRPYGDEKAQISSISVKALDPKRIELKFTSTIRPAAIFVRVTENGTWSLNNGLVAEHVIPNAGEFQEGENVVILSASAKQPWRDIFKALEKGQGYTFSLATTSDARRWGPFNSASFYLPSYLPARRAVDASSNR